MSWIKVYESEWLFIILALELIVSCFTAYWVYREYKYDENKDLRRKKTRTMKKTTNKNGESIVEESTEVSEPMDNDNVRHES